MLLILTLDSLRWLISLLEIIVATLTHDLATWNSSIILTELVLGPLILRLVGWIQALHNTWDSSQNRVVGHAWNIQSFWLVVVFVCMAKDLSDIFRVGIFLSMILFACNLLIDL